MSVEWEGLYQEALQELDAKRVGEVCERARRAINDRLTELAAQPVAAKEKEEERERLMEALRSLVIHEHKRRAPN
jgi:hypothetical protein